MGPYSGAQVSATARQAFWLGGTNLGRRSAACQPLVSSRSAAARLPLMSSAPLPT